MTGNAIEKAPSAGAPAAYIDFDELHRRAMVLSKAHQVIPKAFHDNPEAIVFVGMRGAELGFSLGYSIENIDVIEGRAVPNAQARLTRLRALGHEARFTESTAEKATLRARRRENRDDPDAWVEFTYTIDDAIRAELAVMWVERRYKREGDRYDRTEKYVVGDVVNGINPELVAKACREAEADAEARRVAGNADARPNLWVKREVDAGRVKSKDNWRKDPPSMLRARAATNVCRMEFSDVMAGAGIDLYDADEYDVGEGELPDTEVLHGGDEGQDDDVVDAEVLEDEGGPEPSDDDASDEAPEEEPARPLAQQIAIQAERAGVARGDVILAVTKGRTSSGREVTPEEGAKVLQALEAIAHGDVVVVADGDARHLKSATMAEPAPAPPPPPEAPAAPVEADVPDGDEDEWDSAAWRGFLAARGVKVTELVRESVKVAKELGVAPPKNLDDLKGQQSLCAMLRGWVEERAEARS